jgi:sec-independent protein translocase protein TatA
MGDVAQGIKSFKKGMSDEDEAPAKETKVIEHEGAKPAAKSASRAKAPRKQKTV